MYWSDRFFALVALGCLAVIGCDIRDEVLPETQIAAQASPGEAVVSVEPSWRPAADAVPTWTRAPLPETPPAPPAPRQIVRGKLQFIEGFQGGASEANIEAKPMLVFFTAEWCHFCHAMEADAFHDPRVVGLSKRFVCVLVDADAEQSICKRFGIEGFPTVLFLSPRGQILTRLEGRQSSTELVRGMHKAFQSLARADRHDETVSE